MARFIDVDKLIAHLIDEKEQCPNDEIKYPISYGCRLGLQVAISFAETLSTADVVPKSEVKALKDNNKFLQDRRFKEWSIVRQEVAREIFEEIEETMNNIGFFDEIDFKALKKKYTKSEDK